MTENQSIEWKSAWQDENLKALCGFANAQGGCLVLGRDDDGRAIGLSGIRKLLEELPQKISQQLGVSPAINLLFFIKAIHFEGLHRYETPPYPREALREAFLNAMVHKSYGSGIHIQCRVYDDRLTLWNEGNLPADLPAEALLRSQASKPRNPLIATACFKAGYIDAWGRGIEKMTNACAAAGLPAPTFEANSGGVLATFIQQANTGAESGVELPTQSPTQSFSDLLPMLCLLDKESLSSGEIRQQLKLKHRPTFRVNYLHPALEARLIEYTIPGKPNSRLQKYRLTDKGRNILEKSRPSENEPLAKGAEDAKE